MRPKSPPSRASTSTPCSKTSCRTFPARSDPNAPLQALIFDSYYDAYRGVIVYMRLKQGTIKPGMEVKMMATGATFKVLECGLMRPLGLEPAKQLEAGQVGYFTASIKDVHETQIGDTVTGVEHPASEPLPGYRKVRSMVYCGITLKTAANTRIFATRWKNCSSTTLR